MWPAVFVAHGGGSRANGSVVQYCVRFARAGYCAFAFDIRGDGETPTLHPGGGDLSDRGNAKT